MRPVKVYYIAPSGRCWPAVGVLEGVTLDQPVTLPPPVRPALPAPQAAVP